jgi:hypothetical protein
MVQNKTSHLDAHFKSSLVYGNGDNSICENSMLITICVIFCDVCDVIIQIGIVRIRYGYK